MLYQVVHFEFVGLQNGKKSLSLPDIQMKAIEQCTAVCCTSQVILTFASADQNPNM